LAAGEFIYTPVIDKYYWKIRVEKILYGDIVLANYENSNFKAIVDTANSYLNLPPQVLESLNMHLGASNSFLECSVVPNLQNLTFVIGGQNLNLSPQNFIGKFKSKTC